MRKDLLLYDNDHDAWIRRAPMLFPKSNFVMVSDSKILSPKYNFFKTLTANTSFNIGSRTLI